MRPSNAARAASSRALVLRALLAPPRDAVGDPDRYWVRPNAIASATGLHRHTVRRTLAAFLAEGLVEARPSPLSSTLDGFNRGLVYRLVVESRPDNVVDRLSTDPDHPSD